MICLLVFSVNKGETSDVLNAHHLMLTVPDNQLLENFAEPGNGQAAAEELFPGPAYVDGLQEGAVTVKLEPNTEDFLSASQIRTNNSTAASDKSLMWASVAEESTEPPDQTVCVLVQNVKYHLGSPAGGADELQRDISIKDSASPNREKEEQYSVVALQPRSSDAADALKLNDSQEVVVSDYCSVNQDGAFEFKMAASGSFEDTCGVDATRQSSYICSNCGQSFDSFSKFQEHRCEPPPVTALGCEICGKTFNQVSILKLHLKLHVK